MKRRKSEVNKIKSNQLPECPHRAGLEAVKGQDGAEGESTCARGHNEAAQEAVTGTQGAEGGQPGCGGCEESRDGQRKTRQRAGG